MHFKDGKSEIDDEKFFLSSSGKTDLKKELEATIKALKEDSAKTFCKFPARTQWILKKLPKLEEEIGKYSCKSIDKIINEYNPTNISLIFPTAHINSPASMYGHTFLRVDSGKKTPLLSQAINYAAQTDESNGLLYTYHGLTGGYEGRYSISAYYEKIKEYNDLERRDIWEYELDLDSDEIKRLLYHQFELKDYYSDYYFFTKNCSYNLLWLIQAGKENIELTDGFKIKAIPIDTIRRLESKNLIKNSVFRASKSRKIDEIVKKIDDIKLAKKFIKHGYKKEILNDLDNKQKVYILDLSTEILRGKRGKNRVEKRSYVKSLMKILRQRSLIKYKSNYPIKKPVDPLKGAKTSRISFMANKDTVYLSYKPSFHDIYDISHGYTEGAFINFFNFELEKEFDGSLKFHKFDVIDVASYAPKKSFFNSPSWQVKVSFLRDKHDKVAFNLSAGGGYCYKSFGFLYYMFLTPSLYLNSDSYFSLAPKVGLFKNFKNSKLGASFQREYFTDGDKVNLTEIFTTYKLSNDFALNLKYDINGDKKRGSVSLFYYF